MTGSSSNLYILWQTRISYSHLLTVLIASPSFPDAIFMSFFCSSIFSVSLFLTACSFVRGAI